MDLTKIYVISCGKNRGKGDDKMCMEGMILNHLAEKVV